jgi:pimeloyl-ACP methyl ester carboxylesterase
MTELTMVRSGVLNVGMERSGRRDGPSVVLLHGFPYDARCYDKVTAALGAEGADVIVPFLRGYGPTRFLDDDVMRSGQQAALGADLAALIDTLRVDRPIVAGFDWGGRAACVVAALRPELVSGLVTVSGYNIQDIASSFRPRPPGVERRLWYQYFLHGARGREGLARYRKEFARLLWEEWSPGWVFSEAEFDATASSFDNPDFVDVVVHSYRHRYGLVEGDPAYQHDEDRLARQPQITIPTVVIDAAGDTISPSSPPATHAQHFTDLRNYRVVPAGHDVPQEDPEAFVAGIVELLRLKAA